MTCEECGQEIKVVRRDHEYVESGLPGIVIRDMEFHVCPCGESRVVPRMAQLHRIIAEQVATKRARLTGAEVRFLRKHLGWSGEDFARAMDVTASTVSRWENERESMSVMAERLLRLMALRDKPVESYPNERLAEVGRDAEARPVHLELQANRSGWSVQDAA